MSRILQKQQNDLLVYGLGIVSDFSRIDFDNFNFVGSSVSVHVAGARVQRLNEIEESNIIADNKFYKKNIQDPTDIFSVVISENGSYTIDIQQQNETALLYLKIEIKEGVTCSIRELLQSKKYFGAIIDIRVQNGARLEYVTTAQRSAGTQSISRTVNVQKNANFTLFDMNVHTELIKSKAHIQLNESGATGSIYGMFVGAAQEYFDMHHIVEHKASSTTSNMLVKGVLDAKAQAIYRGLIKIHEGTNKADGAQKQETLLLSQDAKVSSVPELEIAHNDVKCSHSVSTTYVDPQKLFYFNMRGIDSDTAKKELVHGHLSVVIDKITDVKLRESFYALIEENIL